MLSKAAILEKGLHAIANVWKEKARDGKERFEERKSRLIIIRNAPSEKSQARPELIFAVRGNMGFSQEPKNSLSTASSRQADPGIG